MCLFDGVCGLGGEGAFFFFCWRGVSVRSCM